jgi:putative transposase
MWKSSGPGTQIHAHLRERAREIAGRNRHVAASLIETQSVKLAETSEHWSRDSGKKANGRRRHISVDKVGTVLCAMALPANLQDRDGAKQVLAEFLTHPALRHIEQMWASGGCAGASISWAADLSRCAIEPSNALTW